MGGPGSGGSNRLSPDEHRIRGRKEPRAKARHQTTGGRAPYPAIQRGLDDLESAAYVALVEAIERRRPHLRPHVGVLIAGAVIFSQWWRARDTDPRRELAMEQAKSEIGIVLDEDGDEDEVFARRFHELIDAQADASG